MGEETLFLKAVYEHNRSLWYASYPFHLGLYILVGLLGLLVVGGVAEMAGISVAMGSASFIGVVLYCLTMLAGCVHPNEPLHHSFGKATTDNMRAQIIDPAPTGVGPTATDGTKAASAIELDKTSVVIAEIPWFGTHSMGYPEW